MSSRELTVTYFLYFSALGIYLPYFFLYCHSLGFSPVQIGILAGAPAVLEMASPPVWGWLADRTGARRRLLRAAALAAFLAWTPFFFVKAFVPMVVALGLYAIFRTPIIPLTEATTWEHVEDGAAYGKIRVWGSVGFIVASLVMGKLLDRGPFAWMLAAIWALLAALAWTLRTVEPAAHPQAPRAAPAGASILRSNALFFTSVCLAQIAHGGYYSFFSIHLEALHYTRTQVGLAWAIGVIAEVAVMLAYGPIFRRLTSERMIQISLAASAARWLLLSFITAYPVIAVSQVLHALSFATLHIASLAYLHGRAPGNQRTLAQALYSTFSFGIGSAVGRFGSGWIFQSWGGRGLFAVCAVIAAAALAASLRLKPRGRAPETSESGTAHPGRGASRC